MLKSLLLAALTLNTVSSTALEPFFDGASLPESRFIFGAGESYGKSNLKRATTTSTASDPTCTNSATSRNCWSNGYGVVDDFDVKWPTTGVTRYYSFTITNVTCSPDGSGTRYCSLLNGQYPGPMIRANWGDMIQVTINNNMKRNGTGIHFHGIRQLNSYTSDGTSGVTECPLAPGYSTTYTFQATQFGTTWYHSHFSAQSEDGIAGPLVIDGPTSANWDIDLGPLLMTDWHYIPSFKDNDIAILNALKQRGPPVGDNILINGTNMNVAGTTGKYFKMTLTPGKKHLIRLVSTASANALRFSIDGHNLTIITADLVPIIPIPVQSVLLAPAQRYEIIVNANQTGGTYWMRVEAEYEGCYSENYGVGMGIVSYSNATVNKPATPTTMSTYTDGGVCLEPGPLTPWVPNTVGSQQAFIQQAQTLGVSLLDEQLATNNQSIIVWSLNFTALHVSWDLPTLSYLIAGNTSFPASENLVEIAAEGEWVFWIIQEVNSTFGLMHPMHLHGHDFYVLGRGDGQFDPTSDPQNLQYINPSRRDTAMLGAGQWMVLAFPTDNPGTWVFHCHIQTHSSQGLAVQFIESASSMKLPTANSQYATQCTNWNNYNKQAVYKQELWDSGV